MFFFFITSFRSPLSGELVAKNTPSRGATEFGRMYSTDMAPSSSGQDMRFSFSRPGFEYPWGHHHKRLKQQKFIETQFTTEIFDKMSLVYIPEWSRGSLSGS